MKTDRHDFAIQAVEFWCKRLMHRKPGNYPWVTTSVTQWKKAHGWQGYGMRLSRGSCQGDWFMDRTNMSFRGGCACHDCQGIFLRASNHPLKDIWLFACHEVLHLAHPSWEEERVYPEAERLAKETPLVKTFE